MPRDVIAEFNRLLKAAANLQQQVSKAEGVCAAKLERLKEFGCETQAEGEKLSRKLRAKDSRLEDELGDKIHHIESEYGDILNV
jgi:hypothetical protein